MAESLSPVVKKRKTSDRPKETPSQRSTLTIELKATVDENYGSEPWYNCKPLSVSRLGDKDTVIDLRFTWMDTLNLPARENDPISEMTVNKLEEALGTIKLEDEQWTIQDSKKYDQIDERHSRIVDGFIYSFYNARGRTAMCCLLDLLFESQKDKWCATNVGGGSVRDPSTRLINFTFKVKAATSSQSGSSSDDRPEKPSGNMAPSTKTEIIDELHFVKCFVPDVVLEASHDHVFPRKDFLVVSCKSDLNFGHRDILQLRYELLPLVIERKKAMGLLISCGNAILTKLIIDDDNKLKMYSKSYHFFDGHFKTNFIDMCQDCVYNMYNMYNIVHSINVAKNA